MTAPNRTVALGLLAAAGLAGALAVHREVTLRGSSEAAAGPAREAQARRRLEEAAMRQQLSDAATTKPLLAALDQHLAGPALVSLLASASWWQDVRSEFTVTRVIVGGEALGTLGAPDLGARDRDAVAEARRAGQASTVVDVAGHTYAVLARRLPGFPKEAPVLVLAKPIEGPVSFATGVPYVSRTVADFALWAYALAMGLAGARLLTWKRRRTAISAPLGEMTLTAPLEATQKLGTILRPRVDTGANAVVNLPSSSTPSAAQRARPPISPELLSQVPAVGQLRHPTAPNGTPVTADGSPGQRFGRYKLLNRLGEGGMSEVFTAIAEGVEGFTRVFVLKRLRKELCRDKEAVGQFIDEARMQATLVHGNIVPAFDFGRVGDEYFMTQEYIVGRDLCRVMASYYEHRQDTVPARLAYFFAFETLQALQYAHTRNGKDGRPLGIVHRDVSPGNIIVSAQGEVKLADFGIVKSNRRTSKTQAGMVKGNANFMSPEQARGHDVDARSDLFSLGLVLYYCLTNLLPYDGDNDLEVLFKAATGPTPEFLASIGELPSPAREILARALARNPDDRFQTAAEFADALSPHITGAKSEAAQLMHVLFGDALQREAA